MGGGLEGPGVCSEAALSSAVVGTEAALACGAIQGVVTG